MPLVDLPLVIGKDQGDIAEEAERGVKIDGGLMFDQGDDEAGGIQPLEADPLNRIGIPAVLDEGEEAGGDIFDVLRGEVVPEVEGYIVADIVLEELDEEGMVAEDELKAVVLAVMDGHGCSFGKG
jgi:hypothetical protein